MPSGNKPTIDKVLDRVQKLRDEHAATYHHVDGHLQSLEAKLDCVLDILKASSSEDAEALRAAVTSTTERLNALRQPSPPTPT